MEIKTLILNTIVFFVFIWLTGNLFAGIIDTYGFHKGRLAMKKKYEKSEDMVK